MTAKCQSRATPLTSRIVFPVSAAPATRSSIRILADFPNLAKRVFGDPGRSRRKTPACNGPIAFRDTEAVRIDIENLATAVGTTERRQAFISAASPGVISLFFRNDHYSSEDAYLEAIAAAMRLEYEAIVAAGFDLQIDCPDLAMGRHIQYASLDLAQFRKRAMKHVEVLNHALANVPPERVRMHVCWGNYEGPHHYDVPLADIADIVFSARPASVSFEAANPRHAHEWALFEMVKLPEGKILIPSVIESKSNFIEHRQSNKQLRETGRTRERSRRERLRVWNLGRTRFLGPDL
jgi:5-methyltetrahydropteroyltriglutamate--homocysteine methyltransferase